MSCPLGQADAVKDNFGRFIMPLVLDKCPFVHLKKVVHLLKELEYKGCKSPKIIKVLEALTAHDITTVTNYVIPKNQEEWRPTDEAPITPRRPILLTFWD